MTKHKNLQFVWPKDGNKGRGHRGFFGRLDNIVSGRGPDVFLQRRGSRTPIKPDYWGNWDSYHDQNEHLKELSNNHYGLWNASRGIRRYDPESRRYKEWGIPHDWYGDRILPGNRPNYPRFTESETRRAYRQFLRHRPIDPERMGEGWYHDGPRRFAQEHDWFWQNAHRTGENLREGLSPRAGINPHLRMHMRWPEDLDRWLENEILNEPWVH